MLKRIFLFALTNLLVLATISIVLSVLGVKPYLTQSGINLEALAVFCLIWGATGSFISLLLSKQMAKWSMGVEVINPNSNTQLNWLVQSVHNLSRAAGLPKVPEVGVYQSPEVNAFATGPSRSNSLVAVSTGLLNTMSQEEIEGVLGHEIAHIKNGDMVTMTLIQGVVNAFTMFLARIIAYAISQNVREENRHMVMSLVTVFLDMIIGFLGFMVVCWFSRQREFRADRGSAELLGSESSMIAALKALMSRRSLRNPGESPAIAALKISGQSGGMLALLSTHPPLEQRIQALQAIRR